MSQPMPPLRGPSSAPNGGTITGQQREVYLGPNNTPVPGVRVSFQTAKGLEGSVFLPEAQYSAENAIAAARAQANLIDQVHGAAI
jgi:hypothetical protein